MTSAERRANFIQDAFVARVQRLKTELGFDAGEVHAYLNARIAGKNWQTKGKILARLICFERALADERCFRQRGDHLQDRYAIVFHLGLADAVDGH